MPKNFIPKKFARIVFAASLAAAGLAMAPLQADAYRVKATIAGDARGVNPLDLRTNIVIEQGADAGLQINQARWRIMFDTTVGSILNELDPSRVGIKSFGFNTLDILDGKLSFESEDSDWAIVGNGTQSQALTGQGDLDFDYVYRSTSVPSEKKQALSFIATFDGDGDPSTIEKLYSSYFTSSLFSYGRGGLSGQAAAHIVGFQQAHRYAGVAAGEVPTPALLPGLIGMGVAAFRKRRQGADDEAVQES